MNTNEPYKIAIVGLGYVGLPLAIEFAKKYDVLGFDINSTRVRELQQSKDHTQEANLEDLKHVVAIRKKDSKGTGLHFSDDKEDLKAYNTFIVTVPTPIDEYKSPNLTPLIQASEMLGKALNKEKRIGRSKSPILGVAFKENDPDIRNTQVEDIYHELKSFGLEVDIFDPWADPKAVRREYGLTFRSHLEYSQRMNLLKDYDAVVFAIAHTEFLVSNYKVMWENNDVIFDTKACLEQEIMNERLRKLDYKKVFLC